MTAEALDGSAVPALGVAIFAVTYLLIAIQRFPFVHLNRPAAGLLGAVAMVLFGVVTPEQARAAVDFDVLVFLLGLMLIVGYLEAGGFFELAAKWVLRHARTPSALLFAVVVGGGVLSAFFVNDTVCLVVTPVLLLALQRLGVRPVPYLLGLAMGSNAGSVLSVTGNPQNMLVGIWSGVSFGEFMLRMLPVAAGALAIVYLALRWAFRQELNQPFSAPVRDFEVPYDRVLVGKALAVFTIALVAWLAGGSLPMVAIACGAVMVAIAQRDPGEAIERVDWDLLLLFSSLFVVMRGLQVTGTVEWLNNHALSVAQHSNEMAAGGIVSAAMLVLSSLVSNVPAVMLWREAVTALPDARTMWLVLAMSSTLAGNFLLIGSVANLIVAEKARAHGVRIGFVEYARIGVPVTLISIAWGLVVLLAWK
ncbi:MAG TPA: SLC13 family permease [Gemmatimonadaceae bacterium]|nr:SLC13 family permease [Gemmatimonadaceae bacterium]